MGQEDEENHWRKPAAYIITLAIEILHARSIYSFFTSVAWVVANSVTKWKVVIYVPATKSVQILITMVIAISDHITEYILWLGKIAYIRPKSIIGALNFISSCL